MFFDNKAASVTPGFYLQTSVLELDGVTILNSLGETYVLNERNQTSRLL